MNIEALNEIRGSLVDIGYWRENDGLMDVDDAIRASQQRVHRQIGQWSRVAHRRVAEVAAKARLAVLGSK